MAKSKITSGTLFGYWLVVEVRGRKSLCFCTGCNTTHREVLHRNLALGRSSSCGCQKLQSTQQTCIQKYGTPNYAQSEERKLKLNEITQKRTQTSLLKYNNPHPSQSSSVRAKISQSQQNHSPEQKQLSNEKRTKTIQERYQVENIAQTEHKKQKTLSTNLAKYGVENYAKLPECQDKMKKTNLSRYGTENHSQSEHFQEFLIANNRKTILPSGQCLTDAAKQKQVPISTLHKIHANFGPSATLEYIDNYQNNIYSTEACFISLFKDVFCDIQKFDQKPLEANLSYRPDFRLEKNGKILYINIDGLYDHSVGGRRNLNKSYHSNLASEFVKHNLRIMQFRADELESKPHLIKSTILNYFGLTLKLNARSCKIKTLSQSESSKFFNENHLMGNKLGASCYGLFLDAELVAAISIRKIQNKISIERFCSKQNSTVRGGFSKLLNHVIKIYNPSLVESFCDLRYASGESYIKCGFKLAYIDTSGFVWTDFKRTFNRRQCRANMDERKQSEAYYAAEKKWFKIYDAGQAKYLKELSNDTTPSSS